MGLCRRFMFTNWPTFVPALSFAGRGLLSTPSPDAIIREVVSLHNNITSKRSVHRRVTIPVTISSQQGLLLSQGSAFSASSSTSDEGPWLQINIDRLMEHASTTIGMKCLAAEQLARGSFHEVYELKFRSSSRRPIGLPSGLGLRFKDRLTNTFGLLRYGFRNIYGICRHGLAGLLDVGQSGLTQLSRFLSEQAKNLHEFSQRLRDEDTFSCIARFPRDAMAHTAAKEESEIATIMYVDDNTSLPVPGILYYDFSENDVGAPFVLMEKLQGNDLYSFWDDLSLDHKKMAISQVASSVAQLAKLKFDQIGSLRLGSCDLNVPQKPVVGPMFHLYLQEPQGPFTRAKDFYHSFVQVDSVESSELKEVYEEIGGELSAYFRDNKAPCFDPPFSLIHADLDGQNLLFVQTPEGPRLTGIIDFEASFTGPAYILFDYPRMIQDNDMEKESYEDNAILRPYFVREVFRQLPGDDKRSLIASMNEKNHLLNNMILAVTFGGDETRLRLSREFLSDQKDGSGAAYRDRDDPPIPERYSDEADLLEVINEDPDGDSEEEREGNCEKKSDTGSSRDRGCFAGEGHDEGGEINGQ